MNTAFSLYDARFSKYEYIPTSVLKMQFLSIEIVQALMSLVKFPKVDSSLLFVTIAYHHPAKFIGFSKRGAGSPEVKLQTVATRTQHSADISH